MNILESIGGTPLVYLDGMSNRTASEIYVKLESRNPGSSVKDRAARAYLTNAMSSGRLLPGGTVVEATSGNLGIGLALVCAKLQLNLILTMPESVSQERKTLLAAMGAELILTPAAEGMAGAQKRAEACLAERPNAFRPDQFSNPDGPAMHYQTTAVEILDACRAQNITPDVLVNGVGSGATISGVGKRLKEVFPNIKVIAVEPAESPVLSGGKPGPHGIQGIGAGFVPAVYDASVVDEVVTVSTDDALAAARDMLKHESVSCGISSGANAHAAAQLARRPEFRGGCILTFACDTGERYLSTRLFQE